MACCSYFSAIFLILELILPFNLFGDKMTTDSPKPRISFSSSKFQVTVIPKIVPSASSRSTFWEGCKGATPAGKGVLGIIPGSMTAPGFIVRGKGETASINSASHGAGRKMSRTAAMKTATRGSMSKMLKENGVVLIGGGPDEAPHAYKDIHQVMNAQLDLVEVVGMFSPKIVRMD